MNRERRTVVIVVAITTIALATTALAPAASAAGTREFTRKQVASIVADIEPGQSAKCYLAGHADSDRTWAVMAHRSPAPSGCSPADGYWLLHKTAAGWTNVMGISADITCRDLRRDLRRASAPTSVFTDFKASGLCRTS